MTNNVLYLKADWHKDVNGDVFTSNQQILDYQLMVLEKVVQFGFTCVKVRPRGLNWHADIDTVPLDYLDHCQSIGVDVWFDNHLALAYHPQGKNWGVWEVVKDLIEHPSVKVITVEDEPQEVDEIILVKQQYDYLRQFTDKPLTTAYVGEHLGLKDSDPFSKISDGEYEYMRKFIRYSNPDFVLARHYPIRRDRGLVNTRYADKMLLSFPDFLSALKELDPMGVPVLHGLGRDITRDRKAYWSLPTKAELSEMIRLAAAKFDTIAFYRACSLKHHLNGEYSLLDVHGEPMKALDGSYPVEAVAG